MTDSSDPRRSKSSRKKSSREPATIDLKATVIDDGTVQADPEPAAQDTVGQATVGQETMGPDAAGEELRAQETTAAADSLPGGQRDETIASGSEPPAEEVVASPEASLDSGAGTDTLPSEGFINDPAGRDTSSSSNSSRDSSTSDPRADSTPPPPAPERRSSAGALIGSSLLGGLVGAGLVYGLQTWQGEPPAQEDPRIARLEQQVNALRQQPAAPGDQPQGDTQALDGRLQALETARSELDQRLQAIQDTAQQAAGQAQEALNRPLPESTQASTENEAALSDLSNRLGALEEQVRTNAQTATNAANATQELDSRIADLDRRFGEREQRLSDMDRRLGELDRQLADVNNRFGTIDQRLGEQEQRLAALSRQATENTKAVEEASQTGTRVVLAGRLNDALQNGTPYAEVLEGVKKAGADPARVAPLEPFAQEGAPTAAALAQRFDPVETAILRESRGPAEGWSDRLLRMADKVVTVRPVNEPGGSGVPAQVGRIRQALERGEVVEAAAAWDSLPEPARQVSEEWGRQAKAVAGAHQAAQAISADALATLNRTTQ
ncbi:COG4223 family protein [Microvirga splendida]|uniref:Chromosome partition protein Smc n=1 Tax=Microvirga splendida TaxID=2795727 RepID=A0ABS0Y2K8_9HYPH|nr:hypothetical protein [Microvirga splendida]MBJ6126531.1 hypothetical protein [Microvirga splendida]